MHGDDENDYDDDSEHNSYGNVHYDDGKIRGRAKCGRRIQYIYIYIYNTYMPKIKEETPQMIIITNTKL